MLISSFYIKGRQDIGQKLSTVLSSSGSSDKKQFSHVSPTQKACFHNIQFNSADLKRWQLLDPATLNTVSPYVFPIKSSSILLLTILTVNELSRI